MNKKKSLGLNAFLNGLKNCLNLLFPLITFPYISRILTVQGVGVYNFSSTYIGYFVLIAGLGITTYAIREGAKYRDNKEKMEKFSSQIFSINIYSTVISYILLFTSLVLFKSLRVYSLCIIIFSIQIFFNTIGTEWVYVIYEDYAYITLRSIAFKIISIILLFLFVKKSSDYLNYAWITVFANVGSNILNYTHLKKNLLIKIKRDLDLKKHLKPILVIFASEVAVNIYVYSDNTILGLIKGDYAVGIYGVSVKIYTIAQGLLTAILMVTIPRLAMLYGKKRYKDYHLLLSKLINTLLILAIPATVGLVYLSKDIVLIIASRKYLSSVLSLQIMAFAIFFSIFSWIFSQCVLIPAKREKYVFISTVITAIFNISVNFLLIPLFSYDGAALSTVLSEALSAIINGYFSRDIVAKVIFSKKMLKMVFDTLIGCIAISIMCGISMIIDNLILRLIISILSSIFMYLLILCFLKNPLVLWGFEFIKNIKK